MRLITDLMSRWRSGREAPVEPQAFRDGTSQVVKLNGNNFHYLEWGRQGAPILLMLHGFPEYSGAWSEIAVQLADSFHCIAPDQRGFGQSWAPADVKAYDLRLLVDDMAALIRQLGGPVVVVGHDWGGAVAYGLAMFRPELISHLIVINGVHPVPFQRELASGGPQSSASHYFQLLRRHRSEEMLTAHDFKAMMGLFSARMNMDWLTPERLVAYKRAWSDTARVKAMVNWYRASPLPVARPGHPLAEVPPLPEHLLHVRCPHMLIWGDDDTALLPGCIEGLDAFAADLTVHHVSGADHWICHQKPEEVAAHIRSWLGERGLADQRG